MQAQPSPRWLRWSITAIVLPALMASLLVAQPPKKPPVEEDAPKGKTPKKVVIDEDEAPKTKLKKPPIDDDGPVKPKTVKTVGDEKIDLAAEASKAANSNLKTLYGDLSVEFDVLKHKTLGDMRVAPVESYVGDRSNETVVKYTPLVGNKPDKISSQAARHELVAGKHYEETVIEHVGVFLENGLTWMKLNPAEKNYLSRLDQLAAADKLLTYAVQFHETARKSNKRKGPGWDGVRSRLMTRFQEVLSEELAALDAASASDKTLTLRAADLASRMCELFPENPTALRDVITWKLNQAGNDLSKDEDYLSGAKAYQDLQKRFATADPRILEPLRDKLKRRAQAHFDEAKKLAASDDGKFLASHQLDLAEQIYADIPGLQDFRRQDLRSYRMIIVGVKSLPERMSPALALSDSDRWACELLYEGLIQSVPDAAVGQRYRTQLAALPPRLIPMGREFQLIKDAVWATKDGPGDPVRAETVRGNVVLMKEAHNLQMAELADIVEPPAISDPLRFRINLNRGCLEPLAAMAFKILPAHILEKKPLKLLDPDFAANPVGSGPFVYNGRRTEDGKEFAIFKANPAYGKRQGKFGLPRLQEIRFVVAPADAAAELRDGKIDLLLDVPTAETVRLRNPDLGLARKITEISLPSRRIWMLAVNHRRPELGQENGKPLRRALAHAIDRDVILASFKAGTAHHRTLNGPFPPDTWALPASPPGALFNPTYAQTFAKQAKMPEKLSLKFADGPQGQAACTLIKQQVEALNLGVRIDLAPMSAALLHQAVVMEHDYDLAYLPYDFNDSYSLNGVFDREADGRGERNFLGYKPDTNIAQQLDAIRKTRNFNDVKRWSQTLFTTFDDQMPFVPLWQLDFHLVMSQNLQPVPLPTYLDPLTVFDQVEEWRVNR